MKPYDWLTALVFLSALLFATCQAGTNRDGAMDRIQPADAVAEAPAPLETVPQEVEEPAREEPLPDQGVTFADDAFPPTVSDQAYHQNAWYRNDCLRCHETGVEDAPMVRHKGMAPVLFTAKCRSCHVLIPGSGPVKKKREETFFAENAFPPMIPASPSHQDTWYKDDCLLCHESGVKGAPLVRHRDLPKTLLKVKCRTCHVQVRRPVEEGFIENK